MPWCKEKAVGAAVAVNGGRRWGCGRRRDGRLNLEVPPRMFPRFLEQRNNSYCAARGASEKLGMDLLYIKMVSTKVLWRGDMCDRRYAPVNDEQGDGHNISHLLYW